MENRYRYIKENGKTKSPYPMYPGEIRDHVTSIGKLKNTELKAVEVSLVNEENSKFSFQLIKSDIKETVR